jgi:diguanylate cyclase (GGDEF)-like protein
MEKFIKKDEKRHNMDRQHIEELVERLDARRLVARLMERRFPHLIEPMLLYTSSNPRLTPDEKVAQLADMATLDEARFDRECHAAETTYDLIERDALTGLYNRRKLDSDIAVVIAAVQRSMFCRQEQTPPERRKDATFMILDIDHFKNVNDTYGHQHGDEVLRQVGAILRRLIRKEDSQRVYRYGGEEIAVLLYESIPEAAYLVGERLRNAVYEQTKAAGLCQGDGVTVSIGVSTTQTTLDGKTLIERADRALYFAKRSGRNRTEIYTLV